MTRVLGVTLLLMGLAQLAAAGTFVAPEIDAQSGVAALTVLSGALLVIRSRQRK